MPKSKVTMTSNEVVKKFGELTDIVAIEKTRIVVTTHRRDRFAIIPMADLRKLERLEEAEKP